MPEKSRIIQSVSLSQLAYVPLEEHLFRTRSGMRSALTSRKMHIYQLFMRFTQLMTIAGRDGHTEIPFSAFMPISS